jgi:sporulation protein YlmC with PRC-barrel domain
VRPLKAEQLLRYPVRLDGIDVGRAVDLILDPGQGRALGIDVLCRDEVHRFLPLAAAHVGEGEIRLTTEFALLDDAGFDFYRGRTSSLRRLKGTHVARRGRDLGELRDVVVSAGGDIEAFIVQSGEDATAVPVEPGVRLDGDGRNGSG